MHAISTELERLTALDDLQILGTAPEAAFDDIAWLAGRFCDAPISLISLVGADTQWFKARCGVDLEGTSRDEAFCSHAIEQSDILEIPDARLDPRFAHYPLVLGAPYVRFYAGAPLVGEGGHRYGTLCVLDIRPRTLDDQQREALQRLARRATDMLQMRRQQLASRSREIAIAELLEALPDGVVSCDAAGQLQQFNLTARDWHGIDPRALPPSEWASHFGLFDASGEKMLEPVDIPLARAWAGQKVRGQAIVIRAQGEAPRTVSCNANPLLGLDGRVLGAVCTMHDVTAQSQVSRMMEKLAMTDQLTGLPNRNAWFSEVERAVARASRSGVPAVVMFIDLNDFKSINDTHGHAAGDEVLRQFGLRLQSSCRRNDFVARLSGDEFVAILEQANPAPAELAKVAGKIHAAMRAPVAIGGTAVSLSCSIGFATEDGPDIDSGRLIHNADVAMYAAKRDRRLPFALVQGGASESEPAEVALRRSPGVVVQAPGPGGKAAGAQDRRTGPAAGG